jgi:uncharacterized membrane protein (DUF485 family)
MAHGPSTDWKTEKSEGYKTKLGLIMFGIYTPLYIIFILICVLKPKLMGLDIGSLNLAIVYGFGLIVVAVIQALIYNYMCSKREKQEREQNMLKGASNK